MVPENARSRYLYKWLSSLCYGWSPTWCLLPESFKAFLRKGLRVSICIPRKEWDETQASKSFELESKLSLTIQS